MVPDSTLDKHAWRLTPEAGDDSDTLWEKAFDFTNAVCYDHKDTHALIEKHAGRYCGAGRDCDKIVEKATGHYYDVVYAAGTVDQTPQQAEQNGIVPLSMRADPEPYEGEVEPPEPAPAPGGECQNPDRGEMMQMGERLDAYYASQEGLQREGGAATADGSPDWEAVGAWMFDVYLKDRQAGKTPEEAWANVENQIRHSTEWQVKHPGETP